MGQDIRMGLLKPGLIGLILLTFYVTGGRFAASASTSALPTTWRESVAEYLVRQGIVEVKTIPPGDYFVRASAAELNGDETLNRLWRAVTDLHRLPGFAGAEISPLDLLVTYADETLTRVKEFSLDPGRTFAFRPAGAEYAGAAAMVENFAAQISGLVRAGFNPQAAVSFADVQREKSFILRQSEAGRKIRIAGVQSPLEKLIAATAEKAFAELGYKLVKAYFWGSRVMPRTEVARLDRRFVQPLAVGGEPISRVRSGGFTKASDLELWFLVLPVTDPGRVTGEWLENLGNELSTVVQGKIQRLTRQVTFDSSTIVVLPPAAAPADLARGEYFKIIQDHNINDHQRYLSPEQFASFFPANTDSNADADDDAGCEALFAE
jgi:hypothetical protein